MSAATSRNLPVSDYQQDVVLMPGALDYPHCSLYDRRQRCRPGELNGGGDLPVTQQGLRDAGARPPVPVEAEHALVVRGRWRQADE